MLIGLFVHVDTNLSPIHYMPTLSVQHFLENKSHTDHTIIIIIKIQHIIQHMIANLAATQYRKTPKPTPEIN